MNRICYLIFLFIALVSGLSCAKNTEPMPELPLLSTEMTYPVKDLSLSGSANCYIISSPGTYSFPVVKGNSSEVVGSVASAEVLWESFGTSLAPIKVDGALYAEGDGSAAGTITFSTPAIMNNGNAVIAAKDASGSILWSWHIWLCEGYDPVATAQEYFNNAGTMMDRNLGATSATPGTVGALGLLYQWGRKDPFLGSSSISSSSTAASTLSWPSAVESNSSNGTIAYTIKNPTTFIKGNSRNDDWYYTGSNSTDNTRWKASKTIYDPCPSGWRVPGDDYDDNRLVWPKAIGSRKDFRGYPFDSINKGMDFSGKFGSASEIWYPAAGQLNEKDGCLSNVGYSGCWWSCTPDQYTSMALGFSFYDRDGSVFPSVCSHRAYGCSVRCQKE